MFHMSVHMGRSGGDCLLWAHFLSKLPLPVGTLPDMPHEAISKESDGVVLQTVDGAHVDERGSTVSIS